MKGMKERDNKLAGEETELEEKKREKEWTEYDINNEPG